MINRVLLFLMMLIYCSLPANCQVKLPAILRDSMVLQRDEPVRIWGWAANGEKVKLKFNNRTYNTKASANGRWMITLPAMKAGGPYVMNISGKNSILLKEILIGDVWLCSGQSNMVHQLNIHDVTYAAEIAAANYPQIRQFWIPTGTSMEGPKEDLPSGAWTPAVGEAVRPFSAVAYFFAKRIHEKYKVPIGIINASVGGTPIEAWTSEEGLKDFSLLQSAIAKNKDTAYVNGLTRSALRANANRSPLKDKGLTETPKWFETSYLPKGWFTINVPGYWEDQGINNLNGVVWYRREINIPASMTGKPAKVFLGRIIDADVLYINGKQVGTTGYQYPQRRYAVPANLLTTGKNIFVIKVTNTMGKGGFVPDKPYVLFAGNDTIDLKGTWQYKVGEVYIPRSGPGAATAIAAQNQPTALYNAMLAPVTNYAVKGFIWYQGESNTNRAAEYAKIQPAMIADWRNKWKRPETPFLYVQLPGFMDYNYLPSQSQWAELREAQLKSLSVPNTAMVVAIDLGEWNDIHPDNKKDVGERLALAAQKIGYGENVVHSGPVYRSSITDSNRIIISFDHIGSGLITKDGETPAEFAVAGADKKFAWAQTKIEGDKIIAWSDEVPKPAYVRYAWADNPVNPNLYNKEGLPASPFRTDN